jgi:phosphatidylinositol alpha-1,6-mannosyltransferase
MNAAGPAPNLNALILTPDFPPDPGGIQVLMRRLVDELERVDATVVTLDSPLGAQLDSEVPAEVRRVRWNGGRRRRVAVARLNAAGLRLALRKRPGVVLSGHAVTAPACAAARRATGAATVQYVHGDEFRARPRLLRFAVRRADAVIAVSSYARTMALDSGVAAERVHVIHPGVDAPPPRAGRRAEQPTVVTVARLSDRYKGHDEMLRALPLIRERVPAARWVVIGDGPLRPELEAQARSEGVADAVDFLGELPDAERDAWLDAAHVFAMPSRLPAEGVGGEGFGIVYLEAGAHQMPVVAGAVGGALDAVVDGETGLLVDPTDRTALAAAISGLLVDPQRAAALGEAGARRARELSWQRHAQLVERLMHELADRRR